MLGSIWKESANASKGKRLAHLQRGLRLLFVVNEEENRRLNKKNLWIEGEATSACQWIINERSWRCATQRFSCIVHFLWSPSCHSPVFCLILWFGLLLRFDFLWITRTEWGRQLRSGLEMRSPLDLRKINPNLESRKELTTMESLFSCDGEQSTSHKRVWEFLKVWHVGVILTRICLEDLKHRLIPLFRV